MSDHSNITHAQLITLYEVSGKINSQLNLQKLLDEIMDLAIKLLEAEKGVLLLRERGSEELTVQVARSIEKNSIPEVVALSRSIINKVKSEGKPVLLQKVPDMHGADASSSLIRHRIKSVICVPLKTREHLIGTIYLDTTDSGHFFKEEDLAFLEGFANLAGVAIENARTYKKLENLNTNLESLVEERAVEVQDKHRELQKAYDELQTTQLQLLRSEKMASLGMLVAGVAHEINTPLGSISSNTDTFLRCFRRLKEAAGKPAPDTLARQKTVDMLDKLARVNETACDRICNIVKSLRNFARLDEEDIKTVDLHEGIDSTLTLTAHLSRNRIKVNKKYGDLPKITCYANQINQVFMNLLVNACQAIRNKGEITIATSFTDGKICVAVSDTGAGIESAALEKVFDPGFTTKGVGVGTGLGLSITYKIVEEHGGEIKVESVRGQGTTFSVYLPIARSGMHGSDSIRP